MGSDQVLVFSIGIIIILLISLVIVDYIVLINLKVDYDLICRKYFWIAEMNGGLSDANKRELRDILTLKNYYDISIESSESVGFGSEMTLKISSKRTCSHIKDWLTRKSENIDFVFEKVTISRRIIN